MEMYSNVKNCVKCGKKATVLYIKTGFFGGVQVRMLCEKCARDKRDREWDE